VIQAGKIVIGRIKEYFLNGTSFSQETTLCGKSILRNIEIAKGLGYSIEMHYVGLDSADIAKQRVKNRVEHGGHGISDEDIERRYVETLENLKMVLPQCDLAAIYDNTEGFRRFAIYKNGKCVRLSSRVPRWYQSILEQ
jgi:predicted ABC-type ATPase